MAVEKRVLRLTDREAAFKVFGSQGTATIDLDADLLTSNQVLDPSKSRVVNISSFYWSGDSDVIIEVVRNSVVIATLQANAAGMMPFGAIGSNFVDNVENQSNIVVNISGGSGTKNGQLWLGLTKASGFKAKFEPALYGSYDNPNVSGS